MIWSCNGLPSGTNLPHSGHTTSFIRCALNKCCLNFLISLNFSGHTLHPRLLSLNLCLRMCSAKASLLQPSGIPCFLFLLLWWFLPSTCSLQYGQTYANFGFPKIRFRFCSTFEALRASLCSFAICFVLPTIVRNLRWHPKQT